MPGCRNGWLCIWKHRSLMIIQIVDVDTQTVDNLDSGCCHLDCRFILLVLLVLMTSNLQSFQQACFVCRINCKASNHKVLFISILVKLQTIYCTGLFIKMLLFHGNSTVEKSSMKHPIFIVCLSVQVSVYLLSRSQGVNMH